MPAISAQCEYSRCCFCRYDYWPRVMSIHVFTSTSRNASSLPINAMHSFIEPETQTKKKSSAHRKNRLCLCIVVLHNFEFEWQRCCFVFFIHCSLACRAILNAMCVHACGQKKMPYSESHENVLMCWPQKKKNAVVSPSLCVLCYE